MTSTLLLVIDCLTRQLALVHRSTVYGDHQRYEENYFGPFPGYYFTGDGCRRDADGYYWM